MERMLRMVALFTTRFVSFWMEILRMTIRRALLAATMLTLPGVASAQPVTGLYLGIGAGANWVNNPEKWDIEGNTQPGNFGLPPGVTVNNAGKANFDLGWAGVASVGWGFGNGIRAEVEGNFRSNEVDSIRGFGLAPVARTGGFQYQYGVMGNLLYDFDPGYLGLGPSYIQPYLGVGAGYAWTEFRNLRSVSGAAGIPAGTQIFSDDTTGSFAFQGIAGLAVPFTWLGVPGLSLTAEYRFFGVLGAEPTVHVRNAGNQTVSAGKIDVDKYNHSAMLGLRYALFQPPVAAPVAQPAQPVAPAPTTARTYLVFFDFNRADLTGRAREIIGEAAQNSRRVSATRIEVAGHADRSGTPQYNQRLSQRRADAVASELVARGVSRNDIGVTAYGESRPLVQTADGVREPQNRRVEIVLR
jgi:OmpA-OmpF porin, OOP family